MLSVMKARTQQASCEKIDFAIDGMDAKGGVLPSPRKLRRGLDVSQLPLGDMDTNK